MTRSLLRVEDLTPDSYEEAVGVLARGMRDNPIHVAAYGHDPERRERCHGRLVRGLLRTAKWQRPIGIWREGRLAGCTGVALPGTCQPDARQALSLLPEFLSLGPRTAARVRSWTSAWSRHDPDEPHAHLGPLAVDRHLQRLGIGSELLAEHCRRLDRAHRVGYLETDRRVNVRFYERAGFSVIAEAQVLGVPCWFMRREPAS